MSSKKWLLIALVLLFGVSAVGGNPEITRIEGVIGAINAGAQQLDVAGVLVQVTPNTTIMMKDQVITFDDLEVGMTVMACGKVVDDVLFANQIMVKYLGK